MTRKKSPLGYYCSCVPMERVGLRPQQAAQSLVAKLVACPQFPNIKIIFFFSLSPEVVINRGLINCFYYFLCAMNIISCYQLDHNFGQSTCFWTYQLQLLWSFIFNLQSTLAISSIQNASYRKFYSWVMFAPMPQKQIYPALLFFLPLIKSKTFIDKQKTVVNPFDIYTCFII